MLWESFPYMKYLKYIVFTVLIGCVVAASLYLREQGKEAELPPDTGRPNKNMNPQAAVQGSR